MSLVTVVAVKAFEYGGRQIHDGEGVEMEAIDAAVAARRGHVSLDRMARATYQTRDLVAIPPTIVTTPQAKAPRARKPRTRRSKVIA